jgi:hypothetical protein
MRLFYALNLITLHHCSKLSPCVVHCSVKESSTLKVFYFCV